MGNCSLNFLSVLQRILIRSDVCRFFSSFTGTTIKIPLKFPAFTFNKPNHGQSQLRIQKLIRTLLLWGGDHLNFAIPQGDHKNLTHTARGITKHLQNLKISKAPPLQVKDDTSLTERLKNTVMMSS